MKPGRVETKTVMLAATLAMAACAIGWAGLSWLATPSALTARLARVSVKTQTAEGLLAQSTHASSYPIGAVCAKSPAAATDYLRQSLLAATRDAGVNMAHLDVTPGVADEAMAGLTPINIHIEVTGRYDQTLGLLTALAKLRPQVFIDQSDLTSQVSAVNFKLSGHVYCSTSAHL
jgi:hypothetical protein